MSGVVPFTKCLLNHPEVTRGSGERTAGLAAATDAAAAAAGDVNAAALNREGLRELAKQKREKARLNRHGMELHDDGRAFGDLEDDEAAQLRAMSQVKAKGGAMFAASQQMNNPGGLEFTGGAVRAVAARVAAAQVEREKKAAADTELRRLAETTVAGKGAGGRGRGGGGRGGSGGRVSWKAISGELKEQFEATVAEKDARIRELEARLAAGGGGGK